MSRSDVGLLLRFTEGSLEERTRATLAAFDSELSPGSPGSRDDAATYAMLMADLLEEWLDPGTGPYNISATGQWTAPSPPNVEDIPITGQARGAGGGGKPRAG